MKMLCISRGQYTINILKGRAGIPIATEISSTAKSSATHVSECHRFLEMTLSKNECPVVTEGH